MAGLLAWVAAVQMSSEGSATAGILEKGCEACDMASADRTRAECRDALRQSRVRWERKGWSKRTRASTEQVPVGLEQALHLNTRHVAPAEAHKVDSGNIRAITTPKSERRQVPVKHAAAPEDRPFSYGHVLMDRALAANDGVVTDADVPSKEGIVGDDHKVPEGAVVRDVRAAHEEATIAHARDAPAPFGARMDCGVLPHDAVHSDDEGRQLPRPKLPILGLKAHAGEGKEPGSSADGRAPPDVHRVRELHVIGELDALLNDAVRANAHTSAQPRGRVDHSCRMHRTHRGGPPLDDHGTTTVQRGALRGRHCFHRVAGRSFLFRAWPPPRLPRLRRRRQQPPPSSNSGSWGALLSDGGTTIGHVPCTLMRFARWMPRESGMLTLAFPP